MMASYSNEVRAWQSVYLEQNKKRSFRMFIALFVILLALWLFGWTAMHVAGFAIHILLLLALVSLIVHFVRPSGAPPSA